MVSDIERAREIAANTLERCSIVGDDQVAKIRGGGNDKAAVVQIALAAIQSERERATVLVDALSKIFILGPLKEALAANEALAKYGADHAR